eukprot:TRINITY_DN621_c0_g1_i1.p2 TRINITY_DN621_c0_g1~~TRINITY_DN621_c0_g1_i1.p2  ORF type:complete len:224 (-),score=86.52 TRINITY_DN621_c0_g1_i1:61-732(-)
MANAGGGGGAAMMPTVPDNAMPMDMMPMNMAMPMNMTRPVGGGGRPPRNDGAGAGAGGGAGRAGALDLSDAAVGQWPLIAFVRDDPVYFAAYRDALQRLLDTTPFGDAQQLKTVVESFDAIIGEQVSMEVFPYAFTAAGVPNMHTADVVSFQSSVGLLADAVRAFLGDASNGNTTVTVNAPQQTVQGTEDASVTSTTGVNGCDAAHALSTLATLVAVVGHLLA